MLIMPTFSYCLIILIFTTPRFCTASDNDLTSPIAASDHEFDEDCSICYQPLGANPARLICSHLFHPLCIDQWLVGRDTCPYCRARVGSLVCEFVEQGHAIDPTEYQPYDAPEENEAMDESAPAPALPVRDFALPISRNVGLNVIAGPPCPWVIVTTHNHSAELLRSAPDGQGFLQRLHHFRRGTHHHLANFNHSYYILDDGQQHRLVDLLFQPRLMVEQVSDEDRTLIRGGWALTGNLYVNIVSFTPQFVIILSIGAIATFLRSDEIRPHEPSQVDLPAQTAHRIVNLDDTHYVQENGERLYLADEIKPTELIDNGNGYQVLQIRRNNQ